MRITREIVKIEPTIEATSRIRPVPKAGATEAAESIKEPMRNGAGVEGKTMETTSIMVQMNLLTAPDGSAIQPKIKATMAVTETKNIMTGVKKVARAANSAGILKRHYRTNSETDYNWIFKDRDKITYRTK